MVGRTLGHYEILEPLGAGGMGEVYRAHDTTLDRDVAIKVLPEDLASDARRLARFEREAKLLASLNHPNIGAIYGLEKADGTKFFVLELIEGDTLDERLRSGPMRVEEALEVCRQIAEATEAAHQEGIIHRDLKPQNIKVTPDGKVKVLDFGIAKALQPEEDLSETAKATDLTTTGTLIGTAPYMSPEQVRGQALDGRTDIWSFGCVLFETLSGRRLFDRETVADTLSAILEHDPQWEALPRVTPSAIRALLGRCLQKDSGRRVHHIADARIEIEDALQHPDRGAMLDQPPDFVPAAMAKVAQQPAYRRRGLIGTFAAVGAAAALIAILVGLNVGGVRDRWMGTAAPVVPPGAITSLAVLPFENLTGDPDNEFFADGMTDELITELGQISALRKVTSRSSVMAYKNERPSLPEIGARLSVDGLLEASVLDAAERVRINVRLFHAGTDTQLWSNSYERDSRDIRSLYADVARTIAEEIRLELTPQDEARLGAAAPIDPEAHAAYLRGRYFWNQRTNESFRRAVEYFQQAIEIEPDYALAYAGLADTYLLADEPSVEEANRLAKSAASRALEIDDTLGEARTTLAFLRVFEWDWEGAESEFKRAIELNPSYATAHQWYSSLLSYTGRHEEALAEIIRATELDPLSLVFEIGHGYILFAARQYDAAITHSLRLLEVDADFLRAHRALADAYLEKGMFEEALERLEWAADRYPEPRELARLARGYAMAGRRSEARQILDQLRSVDEGTWRRESLSCYVAMIQSALGNSEEALQWLERAHEENATYLVFLKVHPAFDSLRPDPRFQDLLRRMGFPE